MRNTVKRAADAISPVLRVQAEFPSAASVLPVATVKEIYNSQDFTVDGVEWISSVAVQVDVWANALKACDELSLSVDTAMRLDGWTRDTAQSFVQNGINRKSMRYSMKIINLEKGNQL